MGCFVCAQLEVAKVSMSSLHTGAWGSGFLGRRVGMSADHSKAAAWGGVQEASWGSSSDSSGCLATHPI